MTNNIIDELKWRNLVKDISNSDKILNAQKLQKGIYCGFDPTNDSLHLGNLMQIILLRRFALFGFQAIALVGGATGMIGDPSGKSQERNLLDTEQLANNLKSISKQLTSLVNHKATSDFNALELIREFNLLNNNDYEMLDMVFKSINPNAQYQNSLIAVLKKLPLPLQEVGLSNQELNEFYQILKLDPNYLKQQENLANLNFSDLLGYIKVWTQAWVQFSELTWGHSATNAIKNIKVLNNNDWLGQINIINFLRDVGKDFNINQMLGKEMVAKRLETGISYTEFSYMVLQSYDFYHLYTKEECFLQSGGSDQWGNITTGLELIRKKVGESSQAAGLTINLLTKANGEKFGKSEQGAIFLAAEKTSTYDFYQFLFNQEDSDLKKLLAALTFFEEDQIAFILNLHQKNPKLRIGQKILAAVVTIFIHKLPGYFQALKITNALFKDEIKQLTAQEILAIFKDVPIIKQVSDQNLATLLVDNKICQSKRQVKDLLNDGAISVNGEKMTDENVVISKKAAINQQITLIKKGKRHYYLVFHE
ncbi:tyrosine--tRNA ligase [Spiroplasma platyhelix]|uniref:Tyrosine--tRNA ligase n=1 Tax=Spiroplasma platyhelix PALS-1 TaxID=1276218 RepID=A0A846TQ75_9MOLU|nr:tyrosine--tRNA ligase [Spiroplasma platyhelix]MBE4704090.1 Tyrosine--tRNA ligase [Spiroplasma platyhelix PALS-1]NKE38460.1 tyrosine--tRNA ligase [Spiroplasma platyhelix PALS-1]UJB29348.1 tyrosyl-tRNA synthetase [Spiroplasma platyhelix PALS-1]